MQFSALRYNKNAASRFAWLATPVVVTFGLEAALAANAPLVIGTPLVGQRWTAFMQWQMHMVPAASRQDVGEDEGER